MHHPFHDQIEYRVRLIHLSEKVEATPSIVWLLEVRGC